MRGRRKVRTELFETAFVTSAKSSTEDLDEVDRIANHPVLRSVPLSGDNTGFNCKLRRSRSVMGGSVDRGVSGFLAQSPGMSPDNRNYGGARKINTRLSKSTTVCSALSALSRSFHGTPVDTTVANPRPYLSDSREGTSSEGTPHRATTPHKVTTPRSSLLKSPRSKTPIKTRVTAIIETSARQCITPPPQLETFISPRVDPTPPNTAPLPSKFHKQHNQKLESAGNMRMPSQAESMNSNERISDTKFAQKPKFSLPLSLRSRLEPEVDDLSSADSTPQKLRRTDGKIHSDAIKRFSPIGRIQLQLKNHPKYMSSGESSACSSVLSSMESVESNTSEGVRSSESVESGAVFSLSSHDSDLSLVKPSLDLRHTRISGIMSKLQILSPISDKSQEQTSSPSSDYVGRLGSESPGETKLENLQKLTMEEDENSNLDIEQILIEDFSKLKRKSDKKLHKNLNLNLNLNLQNGSNENIPSFKTIRTPDIQQYLNVPWDMPKLKKKLQNKSSCFRGQCSSPENTPKKNSLPKSPDVEAILSDSWSDRHNTTNNNLNLNFADFSEVKCKQSPNTPEIQQYLDVPWEVPKLRKKMASRNNSGTSIPATSGPRKSDMQGSDSGISMSSQEMKELLNVPWDMPKLHRKSQRLLLTAPRDGASHQANRDQRPPSISNSWVWEKNAEDLAEDCGSSTQPDNLNSSQEFCPPSRQTNASEKLTLDISKSFSTPREKGGLILDCDVKQTLGERPKMVLDKPFESNVKGHGSPVKHVKGPGSPVKHVKPPGSPVKRSLPSSKGQLPSDDYSDLPFSVPKLQRRLLQSELSSQGDTYAGQFAQGDTCARTGGFQLDSPRRPRSKPSLNLSRQPSTEDAPWTNQSTKIQPISQRPFSAPHKVSDSDSLQVSGPDQPSHPDGDSRPVSAPKTDNQKINLSSSRPKRPSLDLGLGPNLAWDHRPQLQLPIHKQEKASRLGLSLTGGRVSSPALNLPIGARAGCSDLSLPLGGRVSSPALNLPLGARAGSSDLSLPLAGRLGCSDLSLPLGGRMSSPGLPLGGRISSPAPSQSRRKPGLYLTPPLGPASLSQSIDVDTSIPLERQEWYHGALSRREAEQVLKCHSEGSYLIRGCADHRRRQEYSLAIKSSRGFMHLRIKCSPGEEGAQFKLGEFDRTFPSVVQMVRHYSLNRLPIKGAEHMCLLTPVNEELL